MSATVLFMSMSLDGFVAGPNESVDNGLGDGGERLHEWIFAGPRPGGRRRHPPPLPGQALTAGGRWAQARPNSRISAG
jgi:hypothetical protein